MTYEDYQSLDEVERLKAAMLTLAAVTDGQEHATAEIDAEQERGLTDLMEALEGLTRAEAVALDEAMKPLATSVRESSAVGFFGRVLKGGKTLKIGIEPVVPEQQHDLFDKGLDKKKA